MERLNLEEFDYMGLFTLKDVSGIEDLVESTEQGLYLSRNYDYYKQMTYSEHSKKREELKKRLTNMVDKKNFVILENMLNSSAKVFYNEFQRKITSPNEENYMENAQRCMEEDAQNIINFFNGNSNFVSKNQLPTGELKTTDRAIEMDNKALLYIYAKALKSSKKKYILIPGLGSVHIGSFLKALHGYDYTNVLLSLYVVDNVKGTEYKDRNLSEITSNSLYLQSDDPILILDDNMGTGATMKLLTDKLLSVGKEASYGTIQYNWHNYRRVEIGEKNIERFNPREVDLLTPFDYPGHKLIKQAVLHLNKSGSDYIEYVRSVGYRRSDINDFQVMIENAERNATLCNIDLYGNGQYDITPKKSSIFLNKILKREIEKISQMRNNINNRKKDNDFDER